jgi:hypothetical protein
VKQIFMANQYERIKNHNPDFRVENLGLPADIGAPDALAPGQIILAAAALRAANGVPTFLNLYQEFLETKLRAEWEWRPSGSGYSANYGGILDGTKKFGECLHFAYALCFLARAPQPFGLGMTHSEVKTDVYKGEYGEGFVSNHDQIYLQLRKNVARFGTNAEDLYYWADHKTVLYGSVYYDICYGTTYADRSLMAVYMLTGRTAEEKNGANQLVLYAELAKSVAANRFFWFKRVNDTDGPVPLGCNYIAPIDETTFEKARLALKGMTVEQFAKQQLSR